MLNGWHNWRGKTQPESVAGDKGSDHRMHFITQPAQMSQFFLRGCIPSRLSDKFPMMKLCLRKILHQRFTRFVTERDHNIDRMGTELITVLGPLAAQIYPLLSHNRNHRRVDFRSRPEARADHMKYIAGFSAQEGLGHLAATGIGDPEHEDDGFIRRFLHNR